MCCDRCWWDLHMCEWNLGPATGVRPGVWMPLAYGVSCWSQWGLSISYWRQWEFYPPATEPGTVSVPKNQLLGGPGWGRWVMGSAPVAGVELRVTAWLTAAEVYKIRFSGQKNLVHCCFKETLHIISLENRFPIACQKPMSLIQIFS